VRSCSLSGSKFAAQGKKMSEEMRGDFSGIVIEIGNAPRNSIQLESYVKPGPLLSTSIVPTSRCSKYTRRLVIRLLYLLGKIGQFRRRGAAIGSESVDRLEAQRFSHQETSPKLAGRLAGLQVDQKPAADTGRQGKLILTHL
jgi:hypothetical protein